MKEGNPFVAITAVSGGIIFSMFVLLVFFAPSQLPILSGYLWLLIVLGIFALLFAYKAGKKK